WVRGDLLGLERARASAPVAFDGGEVDLVLDACPSAPDARPEEVARASVPAGAALAVSQGRGGTVVVAIGAGEVAVLVADDGALRAADLTAPEARAACAAAVVALAVDDGCDDDLVVLWSDAGPELWPRAAAAFSSSADALAGALPARVGAAADIDGDGDRDLALGGDTLSIWLSDGAGRFARQQPALDGDAAVDV